MCYDSGVLDDYDPAAIVAGTTYFVTVEKDSDVLTSYIWRGSHYYDGGTLVDTISCDITDSGIDYRYIYAAGSYNSNNTPEVSGWLDNLDLYPTPGQATSPLPADTAMGIGYQDPDNLSWTDGNLTDTVDVYLATDAVYVSQGNDFEATDKVVDNAAVSTYDPVTLVKDTLYHWRVDCINGGGTTEGNVWTFTTAAESPFARTRGDLGNPFGRTRLRP
jgi:hypothetical protein